MGFENKKEYTAHDGIQIGVGTYNGLAEAPKSGKKSDGGDWRKIKINFHIEGRQNPNKYVMWTPLNGNFPTEESLVQFSTKYRIEWKEKPVEYNGNRWVEKEIVSIREAIQGDVNIIGNQASNVNQTPVSTVGVDRNLAQQFIHQYKQGVPQELQSVNHFIGSYLRTTGIHSTDVATLEAIYSNLLQ